MSELREKVADLLYDRLVHDGNQVTEAECVSYAAEVIAIPEIAEALEALAERRINAMSPSQFAERLRG